MLERYLREYGLSSDKIKTLCDYFPNVGDFISSESYQIAAVAGISIDEARKLKDFVKSKTSKKGIGRDFLHRWGKTVAEENLRKTYEEYEKLTKLYPRSPTVWQIKGELLEKMGKYSDAKNAYRKAYQLYLQKGQIPPAEVEEKIKGKTYKFKVNGNGFGLINGLGLSNGIGSVNGYKNGFKNGIINGGGLVNGASDVPPSRRKRRRGGPSITRFFITMGLVALILFAPLLGLFLFQEHTVFRVDGNFGEWKDVKAYYDAYEDTRAPIDIKLLKFHLEEQRLFFFIEFSKGMFSNASGIYIFLDVDMSSKTGYLVDGIGAEYMVEIYGWNNTIHGKNLYFFNSTDQNEFSGFKYMTSIPAIFEDDKIEGEIPVKIYNFRAIAVSTNYAGSEDIAGCPKYGPGDALIVERNETGTLPIGISSSVLKMQIYTYGRKILINNITFGFEGTANPMEIARIALYADNGDRVFIESEDRYITSDWRYDANGDIYFPDLSLSTKNATLFLVITPSAQYLNQKTIMFYIKSVNASIPIYVQNEIEEALYIGSTPQVPIIDGSFDDWKIKKSDSAGDVRSPSGAIEYMQDPNIDIVSYSAYYESSALFYIAVRGEILGGQDSPVVRMPTLPDSDHDGVPDEFDPYPHDFNNDGIPDNESYVIVDGKKLPDVDGDGIPDYPYGPDMWLNTTIPSWFPKPYAGRTVHRYIGPVPIKKIYGMDTLRIYMNTDNNASTGFSLPQYRIGADYMVEIYGRDGYAENASLYRYESGTWVFVRHIKYASGYHEIELDSSVNSTTVNSVIVLSDWDGDWDMSDSPFYAGEPQTRAVQQYKQLHLHYNANTGSLYMNTTAGNNSYYAQIYPGYTLSWVQEPPFVKEFNISGYPVVRLYLEPNIFVWGPFRFIPGMNVTLWVYNASTGYRLIGYDYNPDISTAGWYNFTISNTSTIKPNESIVVNLTVSGFRSSINVYFNNTTYDSLINIPTDTYVHVDWIKSYNSSGETYLFQSGENITIKAEVSDPFGSYDVAGANITIMYPNGTLWIENQSMSMESSTNVYNIYSANFSLPVTPGVYTVMVYGIESNGVVSSATYNFIIRSEEGVALYPDQTITSRSGENASANFTLINIGNLPGVFNITVTKPTAAFPFYLYINGSLAAYDSDGDGLWDWVNASWAPNGTVQVHLDALHWVTFTVIKSVPVGSEGKSDVTIFNATLSDNTSVYDTAKLRINVPYPSVNKALYLNGTNSLAVKYGGSTSQITLYSGDTYSWTFPQLYYSVNITSYILAHLYIDAVASPWSGVAIKASLYYDTTLIGYDEIIGSGAKWYNFTIVPSVSVIPAGASITLTVSVLGAGASATFYYNSSQYPSNISIPTTDYIKIRNIALYNDSGAQTTNFSAGENVTVRTLITSPFGLKDIGPAYLNITAPDGSADLDSQIMSLYSASGGAKIYTYTYHLNTSALSGYWTVRIDSHDDPVIYVNATTQFFVPWNVTIYPDHSITINYSSSPQNISFQHTIVNTGLGANVFEIKATSTAGYEVKLYIGNSLAAIDYNGDGVWDWVNASDDFDGDGVPDTGLLLPGESVNITLVITVPANATTNDSVSVNVYSFLSQSISDTAYDEINIVPEFQNIGAIAGIVFIIGVVIKRRRRFTLSSSQSQ